MSFDDRRRALISTAKGGLSFTGSYSLHGDMTKGYIKLLSSGTLFLPEGTYDIFLCGAGGKGGNGGFYNNSYNPGGGGQGGFILEKTGLALSGEYAVTVAQGSDTKLGSYRASKGVDGSPGVAGMSTDSQMTVKGADGGDPSTVTSEPGEKGSDGRRPFYKRVGTSYPAKYEYLEDYFYGAGGGGGGNADDNYGSGGKSGGGRGAYKNSSNRYGVAAAAGTANSGGGGGGGNATGWNSTTNVKITGGAGGSGIAIVRWGY